MWRAEHTIALEVLADVYLEQGMPDRAATLMEALTGLEPENAAAYRILSYALLLSGRHEEALAATDALLRLDAAMPQNAPVLLIRSKALWALGRVSEAQTSLQRYLELGSAA